MARAFEPPRVPMAAVTALSPSFPAGSCAEPTRNSSLTLTSGDGDDCRTIGRAPAPSAAVGDEGAMETGAAPTPGAAPDGARNGFSGGAFSIAAGSGSFESVATMSPASVKYFSAAA